MSRVAASDLRAFERFCRREMKVWGVPGMAVSIVKGGRVIYEEGLGLRDVKRGLAVEKDTLFGIGSVTKGFTAAALGILVDEKKLGWDDPVRKYMPEFGLRDKVAGERMTARDLLCHRSGLPRHDNAWYGLGLTRKELLAKLRRLKPSKDFRSCWQYQNMMFMTAGFLVEAVSGKTWEQFVTERIFQPLGMTHSNMAAIGREGNPSYAQTYGKRRGRVARSRFDDRSMIMAAGAINSCASDMSRWMLVNLGGGKLGRRRIISEQTLAEIHTPLIVAPDPIKWPELGYNTYALGWNVQSYRGRLTVWHGGLVNGFLAKIALLPREKAGVVVLTNLTGQYSPLTVVYRAMDMLLGLPAAPWSSRFRKELAEQRAQQAAAKRKAARKAGKAKRRPRPLAAYVGNYRGGGYGVMRIERKGRGLQAVWSGIAHSMRHRSGDVFVMNRPLWSSKDALEFLTDGDGRINRIRTPFESAVGPIIFRRVRS